MDLDHLPPLPRGRANRDLQVEYIRDLSRADLAMLELERGIKAPGIKQLRDSHHALARILSDHGVFAFANIHPSSRSHF